jgi:hypothetical protein
VCGDGQAFAQGDGGNQDVNLSDQQSASFKIGPDAGGDDRSLMCEGRNVIRQAELLEAGELSGCAFGLQAARDFIVAELSKRQMALLCRLTECIPNYLRVVSLKEAKSI